jgi:hypothetical protein
MRVFCDFTVHFCGTKGEFETLLLGLPHQASRHTSVEIVPTIPAVIQTFGLEQNLCWFVCDNASNNDHCIEALGSEYNSDHVKRRIRCSGHLFGLGARFLLLAKIHMLSRRGLLKLMPLSSSRILALMARFTMLLHVFVPHSKDTSNFGTNKSFTSLLTKGLAKRCHIRLSLLQITTHGGTPSSMNLEEQSKRRFGLRTLCRKSIGNGTVSLRKIVALADFLMVRKDLRYLTVRLLVRTGR